MSLTQKILDRYESLDEASNQLLSHTRLGCTVLMQKWDTEKNERAHGAETLNFEFIVNWNTKTHVHYEIKPLSLAEKHLSKRDSHLPQATLIFSILYPAVFEMPAGEIGAPELLKGYSIVNPALFNKASGDSVVWNTANSECWQVYYKFNEKTGNLLSFDFVHDPSAHPSLMTALELKAKMSWLALLSKYDK